MLVGVSSLLSLAGWMVESCGCRRGIVCPARERRDFSPQKKRSQGCLWNASMRISSWWRWRESRSGDLCSPIRPTTRGEVEWTERTRHSGFQGLAGDLQRLTTAISTTLASMIALTAMRTVPSVLSMEILLAAISICPEVPVTAVKMQTRCNVSCQLAEVRRQNHTPSITFHRAPGGLLKKPPGTEKESLFGSPPVGSGLPSGRAARAARSKKEGSISGAARTTMV